MLATGVLRAPYGVHGFIKFFSFSQEINHLKNLNTLVLKKDTKQLSVSLEEIKKHGSTFLIKFKEINSPEEARKYSGFEVWINREDAQKLEDGEYYIGDLIGCKLTVDETAVATVTATIDGVQSLLLEVKSISDNKSYMIPFMERYIGKVDIIKREIELLEEQLIQ
jgi:16S rRNA processing protein RimM